MRLAPKLVVGVMLLIAGLSVKAAAEIKTTRSESPSPRKTPAYDEKEMDRTFSEIVRGGGRVLGGRESRWSKLRGHSLSEDLDPLRTICEAVYVYNCYWPHFPGRIDLMACLLPVLEDWALLTQIEESLLGCDPSVYANLRESPMLLKELEVLSRNPFLGTVTIDTRSVDARLAAAIKKLHVGHTLEVGYSEGKCRILYMLDSNFYEGKAAEGAKVARVEVDDAESAIPTLKATPHLVYVELMRQGYPFVGYAQLDPKEVARAVRVRKLLKKSLPKAQVEQVTFDLH
jgi:hypothetical protein